MSWQEIINSKCPILLLDYWRQLGDGDEVRRLFRENTLSDQDLVSRLENIVVRTGHPNDAGGRGQLGFDLEIVADPEQAEERLKSIAFRGEDSELSQRSHRILDYLWRDRPSL